MNSGSNVWPALPFAEWKDTAITLHMWTQIVGKIRLTLTPWTNHSWHVTLYVTSRGLTTSPIPHGVCTFEIQFDFINHQLLVDKSDGARRKLELKPQSVADFYRTLMRTLEDLDLPVTINTMPNEIENPVPLDQDEEHHSYDPEYANRFWHVLAQSDRLFKEFRSRFCGKCSPVHFFWGSFDLAVTRFSGRPAPRHPGGIPHLPDEITREAYSQEVSSLGFWPLYGDVDQMGVAVEWHDFRTERSFDWGRTFHPRSLEFCLNLNGHGEIGVGEKMCSDYSPGNCGYYAIGDKPLAASRRAHDH